MGDFREVVGEAIGEASMCWSEIPKGEFRSDRAVALIDRVCAAVEARSQREATSATILAALIQAETAAACANGGKQNVAVTTRLVPMAAEIADALRDVLGRKP